MKLTITITPDQVEAAKEQLRQTEDVPPTERAALAVLRLWAIAGVQEEAARFGAREGA